MSTFWLSFHAGYACRHTGACCTAGWPIPIESEPRLAIEAAIRTQRLAAPVWWLSDATEDDGGDSDPILANDAHGGCVFRIARRCDLHRALGPAAQPSACRHFPRRYLIDPRGTFVTLSHYCPTAAGLLFEAHGAIAIVPARATIPDDAAPVGLDARDAWPPLLTERRLMDLPAYARWEQHAIDALGNPAAPSAGLSPEERVAALYHGATDLERWRPGTESLSAAVERIAFASAKGREGARSHARLPGERLLFEAVRAAVPQPLAWPAPVDEHDRLWTRSVQDPWAEFSAVVGRYLAAKAFASWCAYQGARLTHSVLAVAAALTVLKVETTRACAAAARPLDAELLLRAIRQSDLLLMHYVSPPALADALGSVSLHRRSAGCGPGQTANSATTGP